MEENVLPEYERLKRLVKEERLLIPKVVYGYFPCRSEGNDLIIYRTDSPSPAVSDSEEWLRFTYPRQ
jgi:5-methyltetrahydrofolate--homocysteine methyltransferase